jgi:hypothetical protein
MDKKDRRGWGPAKNNKSVPRTDSRMTRWVSFCKEKGGNKVAKKRMLKRLLGLFKARLPELGLEQVPDPRKARGKRWSLGVVLKTCLVALTCRLQSLHPRALLPFPYILAAGRVGTSQRRDGDRHEVVVGFAATFAGHHGEGGSGKALSP